MCLQEVRDFLLSLELRSGPSEHFEEQGNSKKAIVKVARKVALTARGVVQKQKPYDPDYLTTQEKTETANEAYTRTTRQQLIAGLVCLSDCNVPDRLLLSRARFRFLQHHKDID
jgi:hypothetical protein